MTLASQSVRPVRVAGPGATPPRGSGGGSGRSGPARTLLVAGLAIVAVAGGIWGFSHLLGGPRAAGAAEGAASPTPDPITTGPSLAAAPAPSAPAVTSSLASNSATPPGAANSGRGLLPQPPATPPVVLEMNRRPEAASAANTPSPSDAPASTPLESAPPPAVAPAIESEVQTWMSAGERARQEGRLVEARTLFNRALLDARTAEPEREALRQLMAELNQSLLFSPAVAKGDPFADSYIVQGGDLLVKIVSRQGLGVDHRFIQRINKMASPDRISVGQKLKVVRGPFHAVVHKSSFRLDLFAGPPPAQAGMSRPGAADGAEPGWTYIRSFKVGLGEHGTTPLGTFIVKPRSKLVNPHWVNPRTGEKFHANDPSNPIGEHWLGLEGADDHTRVITGYGIHGTIDPGSIGQEKSMGCVRLGSDDVAVVWEMLQEGVSVVRIVP